MDRNTNFGSASLCVLPSLSARRAWIEMAGTGVLNFFVPVALRKESVDRNSRLPAMLKLAHMSLSARRAWIEISGLKRSIPDVGCRSPQGERG